MKEYNHRGIKLNSIQVHIFHEILELMSIANSHESQISRRAGAMYGLQCNM